MTRFHFGDFTLDMSRFELTRAGHKVAIQPKIVDLLHVLLSHRDRVVTRSELFEKVWPGVRVGQASLNRAVRELRRVLGDDGQSRYVATLSRRGYRFIAPVSLAPRPHRPRAMVAPPERGQHLHSALLLSSSARTLHELGSVFEIPRAMVGSAGTVVCHYTDDGAQLSGSHREFVARHREEYSRDDVFQRRAAQLDYHAGPHLAARMSPDELREHRRSVA